VRTSNNAFSFHRLSSMASEWGSLIYFSFFKLSISDSSSEILRINFSICSSAVFILLSPVLRKSGSCSINSLIIRIFTASFWMNITKTNEMPVNHIICSLEKCISAESMKIINRKRNNNRCLTEAATPTKNFIEYEILVLAANKSSFGAVIIFQIKLAVITAADITPISIAVSIIQYAFSKCSIYHISSIAETEVNYMPLSSLPKNRQQQFSSLELIKVDSSRCHFPRWGFLCAWLGACTVHCINKATEGSGSSSIPGPSLVPQMAMEGRLSLGAPI